MTCSAQHLRGPALAFAAAAGILALLSTAGCPSAPLPPNADTVALTPVAEGLTSPVGFVEAPDDTGRFFIVDQIGVIRVLLPDGTLLPAPFLDVRDRMITLSQVYDERGLLGLAVHPDYRTNGRFFVFYSAPKGPDVPADFNCESHISEFRVSADPNAADAGSERILLRIPKPQSNHNGGQLTFGPDGFLYITTGDGGGADDVGTGHTPGLGNAQDKSTILGKVLRVDVNSGDPYGVPADNPFVGQAGVRPEIWAYGFRNPWRMAFDPIAQRMFIGDVGERLFEEIDIGVKGGNFGWHIKEGLHCFDPANASSPPPSCPSVAADGTPLIEPVLEFGHTDAQGPAFFTAIIGGYVYRGQAVPGLAGQYLLADFGSAVSAKGKIFAATEAADGTWTPRELAVAGTPSGRIDRYILSFGQDSAGEVYVLTTQDLGPTSSTGIVYRIDPAP